MSAGHVGTVFVKGPDGSAREVRLSIVDGCLIEVEFSRAVPFRPAAVVRLDEQEAWTLARFVDVACRQLEATGGPVEAPLRSVGITGAPRAGRAWVIDHPASAEALARAMFEADAAAGGIPLRLVVRRCAHPERPADGVLWDAVPVELKAARVKAAAGILARVR